MILLTGASGFVGRRVREAVGNEETLAIARPGRALDGDVVSELSDADAAREIAQEVRARGLSPTCVVHLAGVTPWSGRPDYGLDIAMARTVSQLCTALQVPRVLYLSGWVVYDASTPSPYSEDAPLIPSSPYGASKLAVEREMAELSGGAQVVLLRASSIYGAGQTSVGLIPNLVTAALSGGPLILGGRVTRRDYIHVTDLAAAIAELSRMQLHDALTELNLGGGQSIAMTEVADAVQRAYRNDSGSEIAIEFSPDAAEGVPLDNLLAIDRAVGLGLLTRQIPFDEGVQEYAEWRRRATLL